MKRPLRTLGIVLALGVPVAAIAADHGDSPTASSTNEPTADITDLYAWMTADADKLNLVAAVYSDAPTNAAFSDAVIYQFAVSSSNTFGTDQESTLITCKFVDGTNIECWAGDDYVVGDPSDTDGIVSDNGGLRVFAGLRDDPFFLEYQGFQNAINLANGAAGSLQFDANGCPSVDAATSQALLGALTHGNDNAPPTNTFAGQNVLALVIQVDKSIVDGGGPILGVSASTYAAN